MGQNYVDTYLHFPDCAIVAVVDPNLERVSGFFGWQILAVVGWLQLGLILRR